MTDDASASQPGPDHVAIIMDGNGRWAKSRGQPRAFGHRRGVETVRRAEIAKLAGTYAEHARVAVRNVRRDGMDALKKMEKDGVLSEDEHKSFAEDVQKLTDDAIKRIDESLKTKQDEIMQV